MSHAIIKDLNSRYTAKKFDKNKRIPADTMQVILEALRLSASSINSQPWRFIVIESEQAKQRFAQSFDKKHQFNQHHATDASHTILLAYDPYFSLEKFKKRVDAEVSSGHLPADKYDAFLGAYAFAKANTDKQGFNGHWTKAQLYLALGNLMHTLARLGIDSTPMEGVDPERIGELFADELQGHVCEVAVAMGYHDAKEDWNAGLPKARLAQQDIMTII
ncbi:nitroreductase family protein [Gayadomonas joobiniege]|uniref:nitroreductase family protein n=1 Tax=Gayadomonas joobiniege TaxID=1234606 RepID=UPI000372229C|nr:nitroreductase family protein [Gayadomonas joobiniege]